jgi:hypothetical protein
MDSQRDPNTSRTAAASLPVSTVLRNAADLCDRGWCQDALAEDEDGFYTDPKDEAASAWCVVGAIDVTAPDVKTWAYALQAMERLVGIHDIACWNDWSGRTQAEVVAKLREAAALAESEGR